MIKGVNKRIIEVLNPEDECFEKIIFFVNPNSEQKLSYLSRRTESYLARLTENLQKKSTPSARWILAAKIAGVTALSGGVAAAVYHLL